MSHASQREGAKSSPSYKEEPAPVAVDVSEAPCHFDPLFITVSDSHLKGAVVPSTYCLPALACSPSLIPPHLLAIHLTLPATHLVVAAAARTRQANKSRCSLTAFRVCISCRLHISLRKTPHNGPSRYPSSSASLATWYAFFSAKRISSLHMSFRLHFLAQVHTTRR